MLKKLVGYAFITSIQVTLYSQNRRKQVYYSRLLIEISVTLPPIQEAAPALTL